MPSSNVLRHVGMRWRPVLTLTSAGQHLRFPSYSSVSRVASNPRWTGKHIVDFRELARWRGQVVCGGLAARLRYHASCRGAEPQCNQKVNNILGLYATQNGLSNRNLLYKSAWPSVANWLMPQCRTAGLQCDQKANKELGPKRSIKTTAVWMGASFAYRRVSSVASEEITPLCRPKYQYFTLPSML